jgi:hypothetical protein
MHSGAQLEQVPNLLVQLCPWFAGIGKLDAAQSDGIGFFVPPQQQVRRLIQVTIRSEASNMKFLTQKLGFEIKVVPAGVQAYLDDLFHNDCPFIVPCFGFSGLLSWYPVPKVSGSHFCHDEFENRLY